MNNFMKDIREKIEKYQRTYIAVFPNDENSEPGFTYSIGMAEWDLPDVIIFGLPPETSHTMCDIVTARMLTNEIETNVYDDKVLQGYNIATIPVDKNKASEYMFQANYYYEETDFEMSSAIQIVFPDKEGKFPWDDGVEKDIAMGNHIIGNTEAFNGSKVE